ncbi:MAG: alanine:cation symporter family protein, partial [Clostridia bacterium]|nr:alanine:cation symporter family protein [Clostridia bacterium]
ASLMVIFVNMTSLPSVLSRILREAFSLRSAGAGLGGMGIARAMRAGIGKGLFSNEAGVGTAPFAHGAANVASPARQGVLGLVEVFVDTLLMCSLTALSVLLVFEELPAVSATATVTEAFATVLGGAASPFLALSILFFAYATVACWVSYGQTALSHLCRRPSARYLYALFFVAMLVVGSVLPADGVWAVCDTVIAAMALLNITALLKNADRIVTLTRAEGLLK